MDSKHHNEDARSRFFANISHEFRTPLTMILGPVKQLLAETEDAELKRQYEGIQRNASRLLGLVNQLLDLSKSEAGQEALNLSKVDAARYVRQWMEYFESQAAAKGITLVLDLPAPGTAEVVLDVEKMQKLLVNLVANAMKFTPSDGKITVAFKQRKDGFAFAVTDTGIGIKPEKIPHIFDRYFEAEAFFQVEDTFIRNEPGTGIGLALCKSIAELHDGSIEVSSEPGAGTTFTVFIPTLELSGTGRSPAPGRVHEPLVDDVVAMPVSGTKTVHVDAPSILIAEDSDEVRSFIVDILKDTYHIIEARNGRAALDFATAEVPDLVLSDIMMPGMNGIELCKEIKSNEITSHIPVILLTADATEMTRYTGLATGSDDFCLKPFDTRELQLRIANLIEGRKRLKEKYEQRFFHVDDTQLKSLDEQFLDKLIQVIDENLSNSELDMNELARTIGFSRTQVHRKLKAMTGQSTTEFIRNYRLERAHHLISHRTGTVSEIAYSVGFSTPGYFSKCFHERFGKAPSEIAVATNGRG